MTQPLFFKAIKACFLVLLLVGITSCNSTKAPLSLVTPSGQPDAAIFISQQAPVMVSLLTNPDRLPSSSERDGELSKLKTSLLANTDIDYQKDIQPWLGNEITLAVTALDLDREPENGKKPGYFMALATKEPEKSREFVELLFSKRSLAGANLTVEQYKGVKLIYEIPQETPVEEKPGGYFSVPNRQSKKQNPKSQVQNALAGAVVGNNFVLFANDPKVLRDAINNVQAPDLNLISSSKYQQAIKASPKDALAVAYLNLPTVAKWQGLDSETPTYNSQIISLVEKRKGLIAETAFLAKEKKLVPSTEIAKPVGALQYIPASAGMSVASSNLSNLDNSNLALLWQQAIAAIGGSKEDVFSGLLQPLAEVQKRWNINWKDDVFGWVQGEYAIGLLPREDKTNPDWIFVAEKSEATPTAISRLNEMTSSGGLSLNSLNIGEQKIFAWTELAATSSQSPLAKDRQVYTIQAKVLGAYADVGNYEIITSSIEAMDAALTAKEDSLVKQSDFQNSIAALPQPNQGYVYLDWGKSQPILERQLPFLKLVEVVGKSFFQNLRSLTVSSYGSDTDLLKGGVFFQFRE